MPMTHYGDYFFDEIRRELVRKDLAAAPQWWKYFPHVPNDQGITTYMQALQKLAWMKGRKFAYELRLAGAESAPTLYCNLYNLDGTAVIASLPVGLDLYTYMVQGEAAFLQVMDAVLSKIPEA